MPWKAPQTVSASILHAPAAVISRSYASLTPFPSATLVSFTVTEHDLSAVWGFVALQPSPGAATMEAE